MSRNRRVAPIRMCVAIAAMLVSITCHGETNRLDRTGVGAVNAQAYPERGELEVRAIVKHPEWFGTHRVDVVMLYVDEILNEPPAIRYAHITETWNDHPGKMALTINMPKKLKAYHVELLANAVGKENSGMAFQVGARKNHGLQRPTYLLLAEKTHQTQEIPPEWTKKWWDHYSTGSTFSPEVLSKKTE